MGDNEDHRKILGAGIRRRHSSKDERSPKIEDRAEGNTIVHNDPGEGRRSVSDLPAGTASISSAVDAPISPTAPKVRFSADLERVLPSSRAVDPQSYSHNLHSNFTTLDEPEATPKSLKIDTEGVDRGHGDVLEDVTITPLRSPDSPLSPRQIQYEAISSKATSPRGRARGFSLRRTLFNRSLYDHEETSAIELSEGSSSTHTLNRPEDDTLDSRKKAPQTSITEMSGPEDNDLILARLPEYSVKKAYGDSGLPNYERWAKEKASRFKVFKLAGDALERARKLVLRISEMPPTKDGRHIDLDTSRNRPLLDERTGHEYINNTIRSSRYTIWNFFPRQLFAQFSKLANFYFLCVSILQMIPTLSTTGTYTTIVPLLFFVSISMAKEGYDDLRRYRLDKAENRREASVLCVGGSTSGTGTKPEDTNPPSSSSSAESKHWSKTKWEDIKVGDVVRLERDEAAPADLVLLHVQDPKGIAYIETMALDGETNLKSKQACSVLAKNCDSLDHLACCQAHFVIEDPNLDLYNFEGRVDVASETMPLTNNEIIYRGSILRNTPQAIGMVIYSGEECKIRMNATKNPRIKAPALQSVVNRIVIIIVLFVIALAIYNTIAYQVWSEKVEERSWYLVGAGVNFFPILASFIIMFNTMIPLSLYVSLEIIKLVQMFLMNDIDMYDTDSDTPMEARTSTINEELGQVSYIFSDKTGTLTDNSMKFRKLTVAGLAWLHDFDINKANLTAFRRRPQHKKRKDKRTAKDRRSLTGIDDPSRTSRTSTVLDSPRLRSFDVQRQDSGVTAWRSSAKDAKSQPQLRTAQLVQYLQRNPNTSFAKRAEFFLLAIALCHTCLPETKRDGEIDYQAASPDEIALVKAAQELGFIIINRDNDTVTMKSYPAGLDAEPVETVFEILDVIEFSSHRKRMSIVLRLPDGRICVICKGADSTMMQLLRASALASEKFAAVERKATKRKSMEAHEAIIRRNSENISRRGSVIRTSLNMGRASIDGIISRPSISGGRLQPIRDEIDTFLREQERDVEVMSEEAESAYYTPRQSTHLGRRSFAPSENRSSLHQDFLDDAIDDMFVADEGIIFERCFQHINEFATEGLRTLLYGYRFLDQDQYDVWKKVYHDATTSLVDRQSLIEKAGDLIEQDLELAGATAIEDKLQRGVPEAIDKLRRAKIKLWMLTGDKRETAINIGHSCRLIKDYSSVTVLDHITGNLEQRIAAAIIDVSSGAIAHSVIVVDGRTLSIIESDRMSRALFFELAVLVDSVICCRASPAQKAFLVKTIRKKVRKSITLAVGDGANDIAMIQEAHVGIGITGKEGLQAARTSDYSIAQFRFLLKLLLVHGRWNYVRTCKYTVATFWKEMMFYLTQALYQRSTGYTGTSLYESWSLSMFNTLFTSLPVIFLGIFEKDLAASTLLAIPELYTKGQRGEGFNIRVYAGWMFMAASESCFVYFIMLGLYGQTLFTRDNGLYAMGVLTFSSVVVIVATKLLILEVHPKSFPVLAAFTVSITGWFLFNILLSITYKNNTLYNVKGALFHRFGEDLLWWFVLALIVASLIVFEICVRVVRGIVAPTDVDLFQQYEHDPLVRARLEEASANELQSGWEARAAAEEVEQEKWVASWWTGNTWVLKRRERKQQEREKRVQKLLDRPRTMEEGAAHSSAEGQRELRVVNQGEPGEGRSGLGPWE